MASTTIGQHDIYYNNAALVWGTRTGSTERITGNGSLYFEQSGAGTQMNVVRNTTPRQFTSGLVYCATKAIFTASANDFFGMAFNQSQADLTGGSGSAYGVIFRIINPGSYTVKLEIVKFSAGLGTKSTLASGSTSAALGFGTVCTLACRWAYSASYGPGVRIRAYSSLSSSDIPDYSDSATPELEYVDSSSPLSTSAGEGELAWSQGGLKVSLDTVGRFAQIVGPVS